MATSAEKVKCAHCNLALNKKNLKTHTKHTHGENVKGDFVSVINTDIRGMLGPSEKISKLSEENSQCADNSNVDLSTGDVSVQTDFSVLSPA